MAHFATFLLVSCLIATVTFAGGLPLQAQQNHPKADEAQSDSRVINGNEILWSGAQFMVSIGVQGHLCAGSLLDERWVLTVAQCVYGIDPALLRVRYNSLYHFRSDPSVDEHIEYVVGVDYTVIHPKFTRANMFADIALLRLNGDAFIAREVPKYALLPPQGERPSINWTLEFNGWGRTTQPESNHTTTGAFQQLHINVADFDSCAEHYAARGIVLSRNTHLCAYNQRQTSVESFCIGDQGGALMYHPTNTWTAYGLASFSLGCGARNFPGVFTQVSPYVGWIKATQAAYPAGEGIGIPA